MNVTCFNIFYVNFNLHYKCYFKIVAFADTFILLFILMTETSTD